VTLHCLLASCVLLAVPPGNIRARADLDIREVKSVQVGNYVYRALLGYSEVNPFLVVEKVRVALTEGDEPELVASWKMGNMDGGTAIRLQEGDDIKDIRWTNSELEFAVVGGGRHSRCVISSVTSGTPKVSCKDS